MPDILVQQKVRDYDTWKPFFDQNEGVRKNSGSNGAQVFQSAEDPNELFILFEWDTVENARKFSSSEELKKIMEGAGVISKPHFSTWLQNFRKIWHEYSIGYE